MKIKRENIIKFLEIREWKFYRSGKIFSLYVAPKSLGFSDDYYLEIPNDEHHIGFQSYANNLVDVLVGLYQNKFNAEDLKYIFSTNEI